MVAIERPELKFLIPVHFHLDHSCEIYFDSFMHSTARRVTGKSVAVTRNPERQENF